MDQITLHLNFRKDARIQNVDFFLTFRCIYYKKHIQKWIH